MDLTGPDASSFERLARRCRADFKRIAAASRGDVEPDDVMAEAWLLCCELSTADPGFDLDAAPSRDRLLGALYCRLVKHAERNLRHAVRLDHGHEEGEAHPLMNKLASDEGRGPPEALQQRESAIDEEAVLEASGSIAAAFVRLLRRFDNRMKAVADHLLISESWAYRRCARARVLAVHQQPVPAPMMAGDFLPGPWRAFQIRRPWRGEQLAFDFDEGLPI